MKKVTKYIIATFLLFLLGNNARAQLEILKSKTIGNGKGSLFNNIIGCPDKGYLLAGINAGKGGPVTCGSVKDTLRFWLVKLDSNMNVQWQRCYGKDYGNMDGRLKFIEPDGRGGYVLFGEIDIERKAKLPCYHGTQHLYPLHVDLPAQVLDDRSYGGGGI